MLQDTYLYGVTHCFLIFQVKITCVCIYRRTFIAEAGEEVSEMRAVPAPGVISRLAVLCRGGCCGGRGAGRTVGLAPDESQEVVLSPSE